MIKEKNYLKEGPGAGYTIDVKDYNVQSIDNLTLDSIERAGNKYFVGITIKGKCIGKVIANGVHAESYYYGTEELNDVPAEFTWFEYDFTDDYYIDELILNDNAVKSRIFKDYSEDYDSVEDVDYSDFSLEEIFKYLTVEDIDPVSIKEYLEQEIDDASSSLIYGGGWSHATYDGQLTKDDSGAESFDNANITCDMYITNKEIIEYIDKAVSGNNTEETYEIIDDEYDDIIESYNTNEYDLDDVIKKAIEYAENNDELGIEDLIIRKTYWKSDFEGNWDPEDDEIVWRGSDEDF